MTPTDTALLKNASDIAERHIRRARAHQAHEVALVLRGFFGWIARRLQESRQSSTKITGLRS